MVWGENLDTLYWNSKYYRNNLLLMSKKKIPHNSLTQQSQSGSVQTWFLEHYFCFKCEPERTSVLSYNFFQSLLFILPLLFQRKTCYILSSLTVIINRSLFTLMAQEINLHFYTFLYIISVQINISEHFTSVQNIFPQIYIENFPQHI